jgi:hypothetical protein
MFPFPFPFPVVCGNQGNVSGMQNSSYKKTVTRYYYRKTNIMHQFMEFSFTTSEAEAQPLSFEDDCAASAKGLF